MAGQSEGVHGDGGTLTMAVLTLATYTPAANELMDVHQGLR